MIGAPIAVATCGTSLTQQHMKLLKRYTPNIYLLFDNDPAGIQASVRALKTAYQNDVYPKLLSLPTGVKDIDEWANQRPTDEEKQQFFANAVDGFIGVLEQQAKSVALDNPVERKRFLQTMFEIAMYVEDWTILTIYIEALAKKINTNYDLVFNQYKSFTRTQTVPLAHFNKDKEEEQKKHTEKTEDLFRAFFYNTFLQENGVEGESLDEAMMLVVQIA